MIRALQIAALAALLAGIAFMSILGWRAWTLADELDAALKPIPATEQKLDTELDEAHRLTMEAGLTAMEARKASAEELMYLPKWDAQIGETFSNANQTIAALRDTANAGAQTLHGASLTLSTLNDSIAASKPLIEAATATVRHYDAMAPEVAATANNVERTTANLAASTGDFQTKFHAFLYPQPCKTKWCKVKRAWPYIHGGAEMAEPGYWAWQLFKGATP